MADVADTTVEARLAKLEAALKTQATDKSSVTSTIANTLANAEGVLTVAQEGNTVHVLFKDQDELTGVSVRVRKITNPDDVLRDLVQQSEAKADLMEKANNLPSRIKDAKAYVATERDYEGRDRLY